MQSMPNLKNTDPHDVFAIESLLHAHAEKMPHAEKAPPLAQYPAVPPAAPSLDVPPPILVGVPGPQVEPSFSALVARDIKVHSDPADTAGAGEIKVDALKALDDRPTSRWVKRVFMALLALVGAVAAAGWQHYGDDATAMAAEWTPSFVLWTGGLSALALALVHELVDRRHWPAVGRSLGRNAIVVYAGSALMVYLMTALHWWEPAYRVGFAGWMTPRFDPRLPSLLFALCFVGLWWLLAYAMWRRGWRVRL